MSSITRMSVLLRHLKQADRNLSVVSDSNNVSQMKFRNDTTLTIGEFQTLNETANPFSFEYPDFKFTLPNPLLSNEERQFYEDNGYLLIKNLIPHELLDTFT